MSIDAAELAIRFTTDGSEAMSGIRKMESGMTSSVHRIAGGLGTMLSRGFVAAGVAITALGGIGIKEAMDAEAVNAQLAAGIKSTGGAAGVSMKQLDDLATSVLNLSGIDDELVKQSESVLLTFTNIQNKAGEGNDVFNQATLAVADLSTKMGGDMQGASIQLGKALNDPINGLSALTRVGVSFTDQQKAQIAQMVKAGDTMGAQKVILAELNKEFGGSAKAAGETFAGMWSKAKETAKNALGEIGGSLLEAIGPALPKLSGILSKTIGQLAPTIGKLFKALIPVIGEVLDAVAPLVKVFGEVLAAIAEALAPVIKQLAPIIGQLAQALGQILLALVPLLPPIGQLIVALAPLLVLFAELLTEVLKPLIPILVKVISVVAKVVKAIVDWMMKSKTVKGVLLTFIVGPIKALAGVFDWFVGIWKALWDKIKGPLTAAWHFIRETFHQIASLWHSVWNGIKGFFSGVWDTIGGIIKGGVNAVIEAINWMVDQINKIQVHVHIDPPGPGSINFDWNGLNLSHIPTLAMGGTAVKGGWALVGERGPELLRLGTGAQVQPLQNPGMAMGGGDTINVYTLPMADWMKAVDMARKSSYRSKVLK